MTPNRHAPDYTKDKMWANVLAKRIREYYLKRGQTNVRVWVEQALFGESRIYVVRSNIVFNARDL
jgi:hypothetical protein